MSGRFFTGQVDTSTILLTQAKPSSPKAEGGSLDIGSWLTLYQGDGPPPTAIRCFEPKSKRAKYLKKGDVILDFGSLGRVLDALSLLDVDGEIFIKLYDIFGEETMDFVRDNTEEITICTTCTTWRTRYFVRNVPPAQVVPGTLVLQKQDGLDEAKPERIFETSRGIAGPLLLPMFSAAQQCHTPITLLIYEVMGRFQLVAFRIGNWDSLG